MRKGRTRPIKWLKNTLIYIALRLLMLVVRMLGWKVGRRFGRWLGRVAYKVAKSESKTCRAQLAWAFPELTDGQVEDLAVRVFEHFGQAIAELVNIRKVADLAEWVHVGPESRQALDDALAKGRGVVFVTAHCGNWELMARCLARLGYPVNTIGRASYDPRLTRLIERFRLQGGVNTLWRGSPNLGKRIMEVLRTGQIMGFLIDQDTKVPGEFVPFFGRPALTPSAPVTFARRAGAEVVVGFNHRRDPDGYEVVIERFELSNAADERQAVVADLARLNEMIERHVREHPSEWVWMHRRWKTRPPEQEG